MAFLPHSISAIGLWQSACYCHPPSSFAWTLSSHDPTRCLRFVTPHERLYQPARSQQVLPGQPKSTPPLLPAKRKRQQHPENTIGNAFLQLTLPLAQLLSIVECTNQLVLKVAIPQAPTGNRPLDLQACSDN